MRVLDGFRLQRENNGRDFSFRPSEYLAVTASSHIVASGQSPQEAKSEATQKGFFAPLIIPAWLLRDAHDAST